MVTTKRIFVAIFRGLDGNLESEVFLSRVGLRAAVKISKRKLVQIFDLEIEE